MKPSTSSQMKKQRKANPAPEEKTQLDTRNQPIFMCSSNHIP